MSNVLTKLKKFLAKHSDEIGDVAGVLGTVATVLPLDRGDKAKIIAVADKLEKASKAIAVSADRMKDETVAFNRADVMAALGAALKHSDGKDLIRKAVSDEMKAQAEAVEAAAKAQAKNFGDKV